MSKFKVGDKVRVTGNTYGTLKGAVGVVTELFDSGGLMVHSDSDDLYANHTFIDEENFHLFFFPEEVVKLEEKPMTAIPFTTTDNSVSVFLNGRMMVVNSADPGYRELRDHLNKNEVHDHTLVEQLVDKKAAVTRMSDGDVVIEGDTVFYRGTEVHNSLADKLVRMVGEGFNIKPWARFLENVMLNPSAASRESLYNFLEHFKTPITPDGQFLAFKRVRDDYMDLHSGTFDNSPGKVVEMRRDEVDDDSNRTCSRGLHACADSYLGSFYANAANAKVVVVKIHPRDVVAVPADYSFSKMRVCRYEVIGDAEEKDIQDISNSEYTDWGQPEPESEPEAITNRLYPDAAVKSVSFQHMGLFWYIVDSEGGNTYLHKDGTWHGYCGESNFWDNKADAEAHLEKWNTAKTDSETSSWEADLDDYYTSFSDDDEYYYDSYDDYYDSYDSY